MKNPDFDGDEKEFRQEIASGLNRVRAQAGPCPDPDRLMAAVAGVQFEGAERVREHLGVCPVCQQLSRDLSSYEYPGLSSEEDHRIRARWNEASTGARRARSWWTWLWRPMPIAAAAVLATIVLVTGIFLLRQPTESVDQIAGTAGTPVPSRPARTAFVVEKAAIKVPAAAVLIFRGDAESTNRFMQELASALEPYRMDDYSEAARRLEAVVKKYPKYIEPQYYLGVSRLLLNEFDSAIESLNTARSLGDESWRDNVSWYLALALDRAGRTEDARHEVETLCGRAGEYQQKACAAVEELRR